MTANEMVKVLDNMVTNKVNVLNDNLDSEKPFEEQSEVWKRWFYELKGITIYAQNVDKNFSARIKRLICKNKKRRNVFELFSSQHIVEYAAYDNSRKTIRHNFSGAGFGKTVKNIAPHCKYTDIYAKHRP